MNLITGKKYDNQGIRKDNGLIWKDSNNVSHWSQSITLIPEPREYSEKYILEYPEEFGLLKKTDELKILIKFAKWFNENQWRGGQADKVKRAFIDCDYTKIVFNALKEIK